MAASLQRHEAELKDEIVRGRAMQDRQATMLHELNHRVKNTLATVQALARQSTRGGEAPGERFEQRLLALSKTHDLLTRDDWSGASLRAVLEGEIGPYRGGTARFLVDGPEVDLPPRHVLSLGMTLHELVTNAAKHGALSVSNGEIRVVWELAHGEGGSHRLRLTWTEAGGPPVVPPSRRGFGTRLIGTSIERELDGEVELDFAREGLRCSVDVPLSSVALRLHEPRTRRAWRQREEGLTTPISARSGSAVPGLRGMRLRPARRSRACARGRSRRYPRGPAHRCSRT